MRALLEHGEEGTYSVSWALGITGGALGAVEAPPPTLPPNRFSRAGVTVGGS